MLKQQHPKQVQTCFHQNVTNIKHNFKHTPFKCFTHKLVNTSQAQLTDTSAAAAGYSQEVPTPKDTATAQRTIKVNYTATCVEELSMNEGDKVHLLKLDPTGWCNVARDGADPVAGKTHGWVPKWVMQSPYSELTPPNETWLM